MRRLLGVLLVVVALQVQQSTAQHLPLHDTTLTTTTAFSSNSITAGPRLVITGTGDVMFYANSVALVPAFSVARGGKLQVVSGTPPDNPVARETDDRTGPVRFVVQQNYPNPFNPTTTITYAIPEPVHVTLVVYDVLGRERRRLVDAPQAAGVYHARFDAGGLPSGMYFYRMEAGSYRETKTLILAK